MTPWPLKPVIYQINTWVWLNSLSRAFKRPVTLANIPDKVLDELVSYHIDAVWLMGVWHRSPAAVYSALNYLHEYRPALPDITPDDIAGSPYAVGMYQVDENLGGRTGLAFLRGRLRERGIRLILDYVPNHVATDHAWIRVHPDYMVQGRPHDLKARSSDFFQTKDAFGRSYIVAHGRDPYFPGWVDTAQLNAFDPHLRRAALMTLLDIASQCDGIRCDMAMLMLNDVFAHTWGSYVGSRPKTEYWDEIIPPVKKAYPDFLFMAEVYWDMESRLQQLGFDYTYDKRLYDRLREGGAVGVNAHLIAPLDFQRHLVRFIENHDEQRAASAFGVGRSLPTAALICTLPGATLLHDGQFTGRRIKLPVQIGRQPDEPVNKDLKAYYLKLLAELRAPVYQEGQWWFFHVNPGKEDGSHHHLVAHGWRSDKDHVVVVANLSDHRAHGHVSLAGWPEVASGNWLLEDVLDGSRYERGGTNLHSPGLYVDLRGYQSHIFHLRQG